MSVPSGAIAEWLFNGNSNDSIGPYNGFDVNISYSTGKFGLAADFVASNSTIAISTINLAASGNYTIAGWLYIRPNGAEGYAGIFTQGNTGAGIFLDPFLGTIYFNAGSFTGSANGSVSYGEWVHMGFSNNAGVGQFYINGVPSGAAITVSSDLPFLRFGLSSGQYWYNGLMDNCYVFNRTLSPAEVLQLYGGDENTSNFFQFFN